MGVPVPTADIESVGDAHHRLHRTVRDLDLDAVRRRAARGVVGGHGGSSGANADSVVRRLERRRCARRAVRGWTGGTRGGDRGGRRSAIEIVDDLVAADQRLDGVFVVTGATVGDELVSAGGGRVVASHLAFARWREVEIDHVDLASWG